MTAGRPKTKFKYDLALAEDLATVFCTQQEIATILGVSLRTLQRNEEFCRVYEKGIENAKSSLRRAQFKSAISNENVTMQIWLGKQYLGQSERVVFDSNDELIKNVEETLVKIRNTASKQNALVAEVTKHNHDVSDTDTDVDTDVDTDHDS